MKVLGRKLLVLLMVVSMLLSVTACAKKTDDAKPASDAEPTSDASATTEVTEPTTAAEVETVLEPVEISIGFWDIDKAINADDPMLQYIQNKFNITIVPKTVTWSDFQEKMMLWAASGELPDVFATDAINTENYTNWISQGIIKALPDDLSKYSNLEKVMNVPDVKTAQVEGKNYLIPRMTYLSSDQWACDVSVLVRKDWLDTLGLEIPTTLAEYEAVLKAFKEQDPDGNGQADTLGLTVRNANLTWDMTMGSNPAARSGAWIQEDGQWIPAFYSKNMVKTVTEVRELYDLGLLDPDFALLKDLDGVEKFAQGKTGAVITQTTAVHLKQIETLWGKYEHDTEFADSIVVIPFWADDAGVQHTHVNNTYWSESYINNTVDDVKYERILMLFDWLYSDEYATMRQYGLEGVDYTVAGDEYTITRDTSKTLAEVYSFLNAAFLASWSQELVLVDNAINTATYGAGIMKAELDYLDLVKATTTPTDIDFAVKAIKTPAKTQLGAIVVNDDIIKAVLSGGDVVDEWNAIREGYKGFGIEQAIKEVNEVAAKK